MLQADVADQAQLSSAIATIKKDLPPLKGVIHAAGVLADGVLQQLSWTQMEKVLAPKVWGAWHLHLLTLDCELDFFVLYSSAASLLGSPGQASHVAANSFLDALAHYRRSHHLPAVSVNWGPWSEVGSATGEQLHQKMQRRGIGTITPPQGLQALAKILLKTGLSETLNLEAEAVSQIGVVPIDWAIFSQQGIRGDLFYSDFLDSNLSIDPSVQTQDLETVTTQQQSEKAADWAKQLSEIPQRRRLSFLTQALQTEVAQVLSFSGSKRVDPSVSFFDMGMDSLMSVELKNRLDIHLGYSVSSTVIFEYPTIQALSAHLVEAYADRPNQEKDRPPDLGQSDLYDSDLSDSDPSDFDLYNASDGNVSDGRQADKEDADKESADIESELAALESLLNRT